MTAFEIANKKQFMNSLLLTDIFDIFLLEKANLVLSNTVDIDGRYNPAFFEGAEEKPAYEFTPWEEIRPLIVSLIKGKNTPLSFKFALILKPEYVKGALKEALTDEASSLIKALVLNIKYENDRLLLVTGTSFNTFVMDKSIDAAWDASMKGFLIKHEFEI
ncbi:MAG: hypothetical protein J6Z09_09115 [Lachnospiraceae bacterium]|nr:hypothetical protein [Lachnospiraceae bacterium]